MTRDEVALSARLLGEPLPVELMNASRVDRSSVQDPLGDDASVAAWLRAVGDRVRSDAGGVLDLSGLDGAAVHSVAERLRQLRDALRRLAVEATEDPRPPFGAVLPTREEALDTLNALARTWPELAWSTGGEATRVFRSAGTEVELAVSVIAHQAVDLFAGPQRDQLRACLAPGCYLYFLKQHPRREWCSPVCGNRARVARHYHRHHVGNRTAR